MLDAFGIQFGNFFRNANRTEEGNHGFVALLALSGQLPPRAGQINGLIRLHADVASRLQPANGVVDGHMGDTHPPGKVHHTNLTALNGQFGDGFDVILHNFQSAIAAGSAKALRLPDAGGGGFEGGTRHDAGIKMEDRPFVEASL